jgi:hypothetical protein
LLAAETRLTLPVGPLAVPARAARLRRVGGGDRLVENARFFRRRVEIDLWKADGAKQPVGYGLGSVLPCPALDANAVSVKRPLAERAHGDEVAFVVGPALLDRDDVVRDQSDSVKANDAPPVTQPDGAMKPCVHRLLSRPRHIQRFDLCAKEHGHARVSGAVVGGEQAGGHQTVDRRPRLLQYLGGFHEAHETFVFHDNMIPDETE